MIRTVNLDDIEQFANLANWFHKAAHSVDNFSKGAFVAGWTKILEAGCGFIVGRFLEGSPVEAIGVLLYPDLNTGEKSAGTAFWYFTDEPQGMGGGLLYNALLGELRARSVKSFYFSALMDARWKKVSAFLVSAGFLPVEVHYRKDL